MKRNVFAYRKDILRLASRELVIIFVFISPNEYKYIFFLFGSDIVLPILETTFVLRKEKQVREGE